MTKNPDAQRAPLNASTSGLSSALRGLLAITAALWLGTGQAQVAPLAVPPAALSFQKFFHHPIGPAGLEFSDTLRQANGAFVQLTGYMVHQEAPTPGQFLLAPRPVQMSEHADGDADDLPPATVLVTLDDSQHEWLVPHIRGLVSVSGRLSVGRSEADDGRVSWVRLRLDKQSITPINAVALANEKQHALHAH